eukprot:jgi/Chlat1/3403/Chrsp23S03741
MPVAEIALTASPESVYPPSDDSFALADALEQDADWLKQRNPCVCLEIGSGSGYCITSLALVLGTSSALCLATDINAAAASATQDTLRQHSACLADIVLADLASPLLTRLQGRVDVLIFNPPYVPTPDSEVGKAGLTAAWAGGHCGRSVIDRFLPLVPTLLSARGCCYLVTIPDNAPEEIKEILQKARLHGESVLQRKVDEETLRIMRFWR